MKKLQIISLCLATVLVAGCQQIAESQVHFIQGNQLSAAQVQQIHLGQSRDEIIHRLGSPVYGNAFNSDRLVYITQVREGLNHKTNRLVLIFRQNQLVQITH